VFCLHLLSTWSLVSTVDSERDVLVHSEVLGLGVVGCEHLLCFVEEFKESIINVCVQTLCRQQCCLTWYTGGVFGMRLRTLKVPSSSQCSPESSLKETWL